MTRVIPLLAVSLALAGAAGAQSVPSHQTYGYQHGMVLLTEPVGECPFPRYWADGRWFTYSRQYDAAHPGPGVGDGHFTDAPWLHPVAAHAHPCQRGHVPTRLTPP